MNHKHRSFLAGVSACILFTGCASISTSDAAEACVCHQNVQKGYATIKCQPLDKEVEQGQNVILKVEATGKDLKYQWHFRGETGCGGVVGAGTTGGQTAKLRVLSVDPTKVGLYWCEIDSTSPLGPPVRTRTRDAYLGIRAESPESEGGVQVYPPQLASMPPTNSGSICGGTHVGYVNYQNGGNGFDPDPLMTQGRAKVRVGTDPALLNTKYHLKWFASGGLTDCANNNASDNTLKTFPANPNKIYVFTVYFKSPAPPPGAQVFLDLEFVKP